ncbi:TRAP transporter substrate-binding protein [Ramlibacter albus]|uniref:TRAP transporter substrate-binding protein n=1 Tax=Ramlibacter albus TaxID=2079448 RepID=A0A923S8Y5_9BURK|nr:TRAP transporter substrate-binding protein [Ramlibacter albus]MBC5768532.1 TRAP transporter substrate-binding protein [Ramlibacter albus]
MSFTRLVTLAAVTAAVLAGAPALAQDRIKMKAIGQPLATGLIQKNKEQPFFENFAAKTGLPIDVDYKPIDTLGVKDTEQLRVMKAGLFDIVSLRVSQNSRDEPTILGLDLVGASPDYATGKKVAKAYFDTIDARLQQQFQVKLLGVWPFGPQILFCKKPITKLADVKGMKVRVYDQNLAKFIELVGGTPVPVSFADTHQSLSLGVVDCAITGPSSANSAGWPEVTTHQLPIGFQMALNGYAMTLKAWNSLKPDQQAKLKAAFEAQTEEIWKYSEELFQDALNCNAGKDPCTTGKKYKLVNVPVTPADLDLVRSAVSKVSLPAWAEVCDKSNASCSQKWHATVAPVLGLK